MVRYHLERAGSRATLANRPPEPVILSVKVLAAQALFAQRVVSLHYNYHPS